MAISVVGAGTLATGTGDVTPGLPSGWAVGDIHHLYVSTANEAVSAPSGWTEVTNSPQSTGTAAGADGIRLTIFWRRAESGDTAPTVTDAGNHTAARILGFRGCLATGDPHDVTSGDVVSVASDVCTFTGVTTTVTDTVLVHANTRSLELTGAYTFTPSNGSLASFSEQLKSGWSDGNGGNISVWTATKATAGATGNSTGTWFKVAQDASSTQALMLIALKPQIELACDAGAYSISGTAADLAASRTLACDSGTYTISGTAVDLTKSNYARVTQASVEVLRDQDPAAHYARVTQTAVEVLRDQDPLNHFARVTQVSVEVLRSIGVRLDCDSGAYVVSGTDVALETVSNFELVCESGSYTISGTDCGLQVARYLEAEPGWTIVAGKNMTFGPDVPMTAGNRRPFCDCCIGDICCSGRCAPGEECDSPWPSTVQVDITDNSGQCPNVTVVLNWGGTTESPAWSGTVWVDCTHACGEDVRVRLAILVTCDASTESGWGIAVLQQMPDACLTSSPPDMTKVSCDPLYLETDVCQECEAPLVEPGCPPTLEYCFNYVVYEV